MRTKLFLAFLTVILTALVSNLIFAHLSHRDFDDYAMSLHEDRLYWLLASVEGSHSSGDWDTHALTHFLQWGAMLGFDLNVLDPHGKSVLATNDALENVSPNMQKRIQSLVFLDSANGEFDQYPLFAAGEEIGTLLFREFKTKGGYNEKENVFKKRGRSFLLISFLIAGGGSLFLALALSLFLAGPLRRLRLAAERVAQGDFSERVQYRWHDEVGRLITSFNHMVESLQREEALRKRLTQNVAHELRTPLAVLRSHLEAVSDGVVKCSPEDPATMEILMSEVQRLINLVQGIENMTRAEASFFRPAIMERVRISEFIESTVSALRPLFAEKGIALLTEVDTEIEAEVDTEKLATVLKNIVTNALKYTDSGQVRISAGVTSPDGVVISVSDTGRGIPKDDMEVIFKRFHKGEGSEGVGLGLAIAKELVEVMGAAIEVQSTPGEGSAFRIILPPQKS